MLIYVYTYECKYVVYVCVCVCIYVYACGYVHVCVFNNDLIIQINFNPIPGCTSLLLLLPPPPLPRPPSRLSVYHVTEQFYKRCVGRIRLTSCRGDPDTPVQTQKQKTDSTQINLKKIKLGEH